MSEIFRWILIIIYLIGTAASAYKAGKFATGWREVRKGNEAATVEGVGMVVNLLILLALLLGW